MATTEPGQPAPARGGRGWKTWAAIGCGGLIVICIIISVVSAVASGGQGATTAATVSTPTPATKAQAAAPVEKKEQAQAATKSPAATPTEKPPEPTATPAPGIGDTVTAGNWEYTVTDVERTSEPLVWSSFGNESEAKGEWVIVKMALKNIGNQNFSINTHDFELVTGDGIKYSASTEGGASFGYYEFHKLDRLGEQMPPGVPIETAIIFDVAPNAQDLKLNLKQAKTMVDLSQE